MKIFFFSLLIVLTGCRNIPETDTTVAPVPPVQELSINGAWILVGDENPTFEIRKDSIYYIDSDQSFLYEVNKDSIIIYYEDYIFRGKYILDNKQMILMDSTQKNTFLRWRE